MFLLAGLFKWCGFGEQDLPALCENHIERTVEDCYIECSPGEVKHLADCYFND